MTPEEEKAAQEKEEKEKQQAPADVYDQAFTEALAEPPPEEKTDDKLEEEQPPPKEEAPKESPKEEVPPKEEPAPAEPEPKAPEKTEEVVKPEAAPKDEHAQEQVRQPEKAPAKAPEPEEVRDVQEEQAKPEKRVDYTLFFKGLENDIQDETQRKEYVDFLADSEDLGKFAATTSELVGHRVINYVNESFKVLVEKLSPYLEATRKQIEHEHASSIASRHNDYETLKKSGDVMTWIKEQPRYLQKTLMAVYSNGSPEDTIDMLDRYKKDRGLLKKEETPALDAEKAAEKQRNKDTKIQEKIDNLGPVKTPARPISAQSVRSTPAEDFESAFEEAAGTKRR